MATTGRDILLGVCRALNDDIRALSGALRGDAVPPETTARLRERAADGLAAIRALPPAGPFATEARKVGEHLDLFHETALSSGAAPTLTLKLLDHLLEEQLEITAGVEREASLPPAAVPPSPSAVEPGLPGGRRGYSVGSLIGR